MRDLPGSPHPLGATWDGAGATSRCSRSMRRRSISVCSIRRTRPPSGSPFPLRERTDRSGTRTCRTSVPASSTAIGSIGPWAPAHGHRFNPAKVVLDPYARVIGRTPRWHPSLLRVRSRRRGDGPPDRSDSAPYAPLGVVAGAGPNGRRSRSTTHAVASDGDLRTARQRDDGAAPLRAAGSARHVSRARVAPGASAT